MHVLDTEQAPRTAMHAQCQALKQQLLIMRLLLGREGHAKRQQVRRDSIPASAVHVASVGRNGHVLVAAGHGTEPVALLAHQSAASTELHQLCFMFHR